MEDTNKLVENSENFTWPVPEEIKFCSSNVCAAGHKWPPTVAVAKCSGCSGPVLMVKMEQCPFCNEPVEAMNLRTDHCPSGSSVMPLCKGSASMAESSVIEMQRHHAESVETPKEAKVENGN